MHYTVGYISRDRTEWIWNTFKWHMTYNTRLLLHRCCMVSGLLAITIFSRFYAWYHDHWQSFLCDHGSAAAHQIECKTSLITFDIYMHALGFNYLAIDLVSKGNYSNIISRDCFIFLS